MADDGLPPLREVIAQLGLEAKKSLGQNFLFDLNLTGRIARAAGPLEGFNVVEVGPGPGGLTRALLLHGASQVIAVERDERVLPALAEIANAYRGRLRVIAADALSLHWTREVSPPAKVVANLPYNIATPLLIGWLTAAWPPWFTSLTLMFQKEVADRIVAGPGSKIYGRLSVLSQCRATARRLFDIDRRAFMPPPAVTSSVVQIVPNNNADTLDVRALERITASAFGQRRKMLRQSLRTLLPDPLPLLAAAAIDPALRAEQLTVKDFTRLAAHLEEFVA